MKKYGVLLMICVLLAVSATSFGAPFANWTFEDRAQDLADGVIALGDGSISGKYETGSIDSVNGFLLSGWASQYVGVWSDVTPDGSALSIYFDGDKDNFAPHNPNDAKTAVNLELIEWMPLEWSIGCDVMFESGGIGTKEGIITRGGGFFRLTKEADNTFRVQFQAVEGSSSTYSLSSTVTAVAGVWYTVVATSDGDTLSLYVNDDVTTLDISAGADNTMDWSDQGTYDQWNFSPNEGSKLNGYMDNIFFNDDAHYITPAAKKYLATNPNPGDYGTVHYSPAELSWVNPDPNEETGTITCTVYFSEVAIDPNRTGLTGLTLDPGDNSVLLSELGITEDLEDANDFYWVVDCVDSSVSDPAVGKAPYNWVFFTFYNQAPTVDAGEDQLLYGDGTNYPTVTLTGTATDEGLPDPPAALTTTWARIGGPDGAVITDESSLTTDVTVTESGTYVFELTAFDGESYGSDTVTVIVGIDSCEASNLNGEDYNAMDFDENCIVDLLDFAEFAAEWLTCTNTLETCF